MPLYVNVYQSLSDDGIPVPCFDTSETFHDVSDAADNTIPTAQGWRYAYTVEIDPVRQQTRNLTELDLARMVREQEADAAMERRYEAGLRVRRA